MRAIGGWPHGSTFCPVKKGRITVYSGLILLWVKLANCAARNSDFMGNTVKKITVIGSCLSFSIVNRLMRGLSSSVELATYSHLRTDFLVKILRGEGKECNVGVPDDSLEELFCLLKDHSKHPAMLKRRLKFQARSKLQSISEDIKNSQVLLVDNNYDLGRVLARVRFHEQDLLLSNINTATDLVSKSSELDSDQIFSSLIELLELIFEIAPRISVFYFNYPTTGFGLKSNLKVLRRVANANLLNELVRTSLNIDSLSGGLTYCGNLNVPKGLCSSKGALYFEDEFYETLADLIRYKLKGSINERFFDDFNTMKMQVDRLRVTDRPVRSSPYVDLPDRQYWKPAVADPYPLSIKDLYVKRFSISRNDGVATCGSCFAQHIGKRLHRSGYNYMDVEPVSVGMPSDEAKTLGYGIYSARYGNVYTSRQLLQLYKRAFSEIEFDEVWTNKEGKFVDPFRPNLCGEGFASAEDVLKEQRDHLANVRRMFESLNVFVFTMGLTETWANRKTGAAYPICPGVTAGTFDPHEHEFLNLDYATILDEMESFLVALRTVNPTAKVLLTVSPVPLTATAEDRHVLLSTMASKSILRAVADQLYRLHEYVDYFPSYDIIMSPPFKGMFFKSNLRSIHEEGVDFVMSHFFSQHKLTDDDKIQQVVGQSVTGIGSDQSLAQEPSGDDVDDEAFCDEAFLELERKTRTQ